MSGHIKDWLLLEDREPGVQGDPRESSALTGRHCPSGLTTWWSHGYNGVLSTAPGMASDLPGSIKQQETRTGLQTWLQPGSESCEGESDIVALSPGTPPASLGPAQAEMGSSWRAQRSFQRLPGRDNKG